MSKLTKLTEIVTKIVNEKGYRNCYAPEEVEEVLGAVNFYALFHELSNRMYPVYSFLADGDMPSTLKYRGAKLFPGKPLRCPSVQEVQTGSRQDGKIHPHFLRRTTGTLRHPGAA